MQILHVDSFTILQAHAAQERIHKVEATVQWDWFLYTNLYYALQEACKEGRADVSILSWVYTHIWNHLPFIPCFKTWLSTRVT